MHSYKCERCGKEKFAKYKSLIKRYCSHKCSNYGKRVGEMTTIECIECHVEFTLKLSTKRTRERNGVKIKYCSQKCMGKNRAFLKNIKCKHCNLEFKPNRSASLYCSRKCASDNAVLTGSKKRSGYWYENGYKVLYAGNGKGIKEHIKVMEDFIGRKLNKNEVVHHINEDKLDNRLENLKLMNRADHSALHRIMELNKGKSLFGK